MYQQAGRTVEAPFVNSTIIRGGAHLRTRKITLLAGAVYALGSVLGVATLGVAASAAKAGGNTGNGTFVLDGVTPVLSRAKAGVYTLRCVAAAANSGTFRLDDPDGIVLGDVTITPGAGGTVVLSEHIKGTLTDGATDFVVGDGFDVTVAAGTGKGRLSTAAATDGSQAPTFVLPYAVDASGGDVEAIAYESGDFIQEALVLGAGHTLASIREALRRHNITFG